MTRKENELLAWRHDLHRQPELGFKEIKTAEKVASLLKGFGLEVHTGIGKTGVVAVLRAGHSDKAIGLRADMDALPIEEKNTFEYKSVNPGVFHGCGHDGHTAMLLGAAKSLAENPDFSGTIYFIFQPSEEDGLGAHAMIEDGLFSRFPMEAVFGMHNMPGIPAGHFAVRTGPIMTSEDTFEINIKGRGGHSSMPEKLIDPIVIGSEIILALQSIVSRSASPREWAVLSVTEFITDGARNVVPSNVLIKGDCRALSIETQTKIEQRMRELVEGICSAHGANGMVHYRQDFIATINEEKETRFAAEAARRIAGVPAVNANCETCGASEDFARMLQEKPGCYILIGNGEEGRHSTPLHNPTYDLNDDILAIGRDYWVELVKRRLPLKG